MQNMESQYPALSVHVSRGSYTESTHSLNLVEVFDHNLVSHGDTESKIFPRSSIKMIQAMVFAESGAMEKFSLGDEYLALACASHHGEKIHTDLVEKGFAKIGIDYNSMHCGPHEPVSKATARSLILEQKPITSLHNNCSGKHFAMMAACLAQGWNENDYWQAHHPLQLRIQELLSLLSEETINEWAWDGCAIPNYRISLAGLARAMFGFLQPNQYSQPIAKVLQKILAACCKYPELMSGSQAYPAKLFHLSGGNLLVKLGAEGSCCGINFQRQSTFAMKSLDGHERAMRAGLLYLIKTWGIYNPEFEKILELSLTNTRQDVIGSISSI